MGWEEIVLKLSTNQLTLQEAFRASGMKTMKDFTMKLIMTAGKNKGTDIGKAANGVVKSLQAQARARASTTMQGKAVQKGAEKVARNTIQNKVVQKGVENFGKTTLKGKVVQNTGKQVIKKLGGRVAINIGTRAVGRSIGIKIVAGLAVGVVGVALVAGSFLLDVRDIYNATKSEEAQEVTEASSDTAPATRYRLYENPKITREGWGIYASLIGGIEFEIDENGKVSGHYQKTEKEAGLAVKGYKQPDIIKNYDITGNFDYRSTGNADDEKNKAGKEISLEITGSSTEKKGPKDLYTHDFEIEAEGYFNGNNFVFDIFKVSNRVNPDKSKTTYWKDKDLTDGYFKTPSGQVHEKSFKWSTGMLEGWTAVKVEDFERNLTQEVK